MEEWWLVLPGTLTMIAVVSLGLAVILLAAGVVALRRRRILKAGLRLVLAAAFGFLVTVLALLAFGLRGYQALTFEETAALVAVEPAGPQRFVARFSFPDGRTERLVLSGDELYVDARVLKWKYWANVMGLRTLYELDRVGGRYRQLADERAKPRTLHSLAAERPVNLFQLRSRFPALAPLYDAEYGSGTFVPADRPITYEILVSTTGLLARPARDARQASPQ